MSYEFCTKKVPYDEAEMREFGRLGPAYEGEIRGFWHPSEDGGPSTKYTIRVGWSDDPPHLTPEMRRRVMQGQPPYLRTAREEGYPVAAKGRIYPVSEERLACPWFTIPEWWPRMYSVDPGYTMTAALFYAYDVDSDVVYVTNEYYQGQRPPHVHARAIKAYGGDWMPGVLDPYATGRLYDGQQMVDLYCNEGLNIVLGDDYGVQRGVEECYGRMETGRLKVFPHCRNFFWELALYQADDHGKPDKKRGNDHLMDTMRIGVASIGRGLPRSRSLRRDPSDVDRPWLDRARSGIRRAADRIAGF